MALLKPELRREIAEGRIVLGGCTLAPEAPKWRCNTCRHEWGHPRITYIERDGQPGQIRVD
jgi:hypothetical protein